MRYAELLQGPGEYTITNTVPFSGEAYLVDPTHLQRNLEEALAENPPPALQTQTIDVRSIMDEIPPLFPGIENPFSDG